MTSNELRPLWLDALLKMTQTVEIQIGMEFLEFLSDKQRIMLQEFDYWLVKRDIPINSATF